MFRKGGLYCREPYDFVHCAEPMQLISHTVPPIFGERGGSFSTMESIH